jgi:hypothetical protein
VTFALAPGQAHEAPMAPMLLDGLPGSPRWVVGDRGLSSDALREQVWNMGARPAIPARRDEAPVRCPGWIYVNRNRVEVLFTQMTKAHLFAAGTERNDIADLDGAVADQDAVDQQLDQLPLLVEVGMG